MMTEQPGHSLRRLLLIDYLELKKQLTRKIGSAERAEDALQDTWMRLGRAKPAEPVQRPFSYVLRIAYFLALKRLYKERDNASIDDARAALDLVDDAPDPERVATARSDLAAVREALAELTPRRRQILLAARLRGTPLREIAVQHGISQRMVELELKAALQLCGDRIERKIVQRFGPRPKDVSDT